LASRIASALILLFVISQDWTMFFAAYQAPCYDERRAPNITAAQHGTLRSLRRIARTDCSRTERKHKHADSAHVVRLPPRHFAFAVPKSNRNIA
jgi:hypothetical protein